MVISKINRLEWREQQPFSIQFNDVYFNIDPENPHAGMEETDYVFIDKNRLIERWKSRSQNVFTIAETGFGTGLNFLRTWQHWLEYYSLFPNQNCRLHFISTEKFPLNKNELAQALHLWPQLSELSQRLLSQYHTFTPGFHRLYFDNSAVTLTLLIGDSVEMLKQLHASVDAWYLDGFAPSKNPDMWSAKLFHEMQRLSHVGSTFATYTAASTVRKGLINYGFQVNKSRGYGKKREMLYGELISPHKSSYSAFREFAPNTASQKEAIVVGAGIAGCSTARALADRGWKVHLLEAGNQIANGASGNPIGILYPHPGKTDTPAERFSMIGLPYTTQLMKRIGVENYNYALCGLMQSAQHSSDTGHFKKVASRNLPTQFVEHLTNEEASTRCGITVTNNTLWFLESGWVNPVALCRHLIDHPYIQLQLNADVVTLSSNTQWQVALSNQVVLNAPVVVICNAYAAHQFSQLSHLPLQAVRGQIGSVPADIQSSQLNSAICSDHYITPSIHGEHIIGASFVPNSQDLGFSEREANEILNAIKQLSPDFKNLTYNAEMKWRASIRCATYDHLPLAGQLIDHTSFMQGKFRYNTVAHDLPWLSGLFCNIGHGSKGLITAPLCGELIASLVSGEPLPLDDDILTAINPNRFSFKQKGLNALSRSCSAYSSPLG